MTPLEILAIGFLAFCAAIVLVGYLVARRELDDDMRNPWERFE